MINSKRFMSAVYFGLLVSLVSFSSLSLAKANSAPTAGSPWAALKDLQAGNSRFCDGKLTHDRQDPVRREGLSTSQHPKAIVISCSDSRVPAEIVFDQGLGDIFSIRLAGHVLNAEAVASVEYAVEHLGTRLIVVMGHESCGAVKAAVTIPEGKSAGSESLDQLLSQIRKNVAGHYPKDANDKILREPVEANVTGVTKDLVNRSAIIQHAVAGEKVILVQAVYSLASGKAKFIDVGQTSLKQLAMGDKKESKPEAKSEAKHDAHVDSHERAPASAKPEKITAEKKDDHASADHAHH